MKKKATQVRKIIHLKLKKKLKPQRISIQRICLIQKIIRLKVFKMRLQKLKINLVNMKMLIGAAWDSRK